MTEFFYRYVDRRLANFADEWGDSTGSRPDVVLRKYGVIKHTPKGTWIDEGWDSKKFVLRDARRRWACPTVEEAEESFMARKRRQLSILQAHQRHVEDVMAMVEGTSLRLVRA